MAERIFHFVLGVLATWRIAHLLAYEDGPWSVLVRLRRVLGRGFIGTLWDCLQCSSLWIAAPIAYALSRGAGEGVLTWLGLSGGACLLDRLGRPGLATTSVAIEGGDDGMLRTEANGIELEQSGDRAGPNQNGAGPTSG